MELLSCLEEFVVLELVSVDLDLEGDLGEREEELLEEEEDNDDDEWEDDEDFVDDEVGDGDLELPRRSCLSR